MIIASCAGTVWGFDRATGETSWKRDLKSGFHAEPVVAGSTYVVPVDDGTVAAFDAPNGELLWQTEIGPRGIFSGMIKMGDHAVGALHGKTISPYSDFLLHDMGIGADDIPQGAASERELRTSPLMGLRTRDPLWHDGRFGAGTFEDRVTLAIEEHGLFGSEARDAGVVRVRVRQQHRHARHGGSGTGRPA